jgi:N-acyl-D-aspartate/D-glutamate deacylase
MTAFPAEKFGIADRGKIKKGLKADLVIFDLDKVADNATYDDPHQYPDGIINVMVNGRWVVNDKSFTDEKAGKILLKN